MFGLLWDIIHYAIGSLFVGLILTCALVGLLFFIIKGFYTKRAFSGLSIVAGLVLTLILPFQIIPMCGAIALKWKCQDLKEWVDENLVHPEQYLVPREISSEESQELVQEIIEQYPIVDSFVGSGIFEGYDTSNISQAIADTLNDFLNPFIYKALGWSIFFVVLTAVIVVWTMKPKRNTYSSDSTLDGSFTSTGDFDNFSGSSF